MSKVFGGEERRESASFPPENSEGQGFAVPGAPVFC